MNFRSLFSWRTPKNPRILILTSRLEGCGGCETISKTLVEQLEHHPYAVDVLLHWPGDLFHLKKQKKWFRNLALQDLLPLLSRYDLAHIHIPWYSDEWGGGFSAIQKKIDCPLIYTCHSIVAKEENDNQRYAFTFQKTQEETMERAHLITYPIAAARNCAQELYPQHTSKSVVVINGLVEQNVRFSHPLLLPYKKRFCRPHEKILLFVGRLNWEKGIFELADAFMKLKQRHALKLLIVGEGPAEDELKQRLEKEKNVYFIPSQTQKNLSFFYQLADVLIVPSYSESFCLVAAEAMLNKLPVLITKTYGATDAFQLDSTQPLAIPIQKIRSSPAIVDAFEYFVAHPGFSREMTLRAENTIRKNYSVERMMEQVMQAYQSVLKPQ